MASMVATPSVSVVIPAHNEARFIGATLTQLLIAFKELGVKCEIVVVNDSSTDDTASVARQMGVCVVDVELRNIGAVRNAGAKVANAPRLIFVDADTLVPVTTIAATLSALNDGCIGGGAMVLLDDQKKIPWSKYLIYLVAVTLWQRLGGWAAGCYMFCSANAFAEIDGFPEEYFAAEEFFFSRRMKKLGRFVVLKQTVKTSARKLHDYSVWQLLRFLIRPMLSVGGFLKSRTGLEVLYEHKRDID